MSRVIDRLLREQHVPANVRTDLVRMPAIAIDNIAEYFYAHGRDEWSLDRDFPNIAPPFDEWWMEFHLPKSVRQYWQGSVGLICYARELDEYDEISPVEGGALSGHPKWEVHFTCILDDDNGHMTAPLWDIHFLVCADGSPLKMGNRVGFSFQELDESQRLGWNNQIASSVGENWHSGLMKALIQPALLALSFMHCKNVIQREVRPEEWRLKQARNKKRPAPVTYRVLEIEPMKRVLRSEGGIEHNGLKKALHICRGHFKTYDEKPLFGKVRGTFWWPATVRGSADEGIATKDYAVKAPVGR